MYNLFITSSVNKHSDCLLLISKTAAAEWQQGGTRGERRGSEAVSLVAGPFIQQQRRKLVQRCSPKTEAAPAAGHRSADFQADSLGPLEWNSGSEGIIVTQISVLRLLATPALVPR